MQCCEILMSWETEPEAAEPMMEGGVVTFSVAADCESSAAGAAAGRGGGAAPAREDTAP